MANRSQGKDKQSPRTDTSSQGTRVNDYLEGEGSGVAQQGGTATSGRQQTASSSALGDAAEGPATRGTLSSGYSSRSSTGGTGGGVLQQRGSGFSPGADSRKGAHENESDALAAEGVAAGAAGIAEDRHGKPAGESPDAEKNDEYAQRADGAAAVTGVSGVSGGGRGTTRAGNTRK